MIKGLENNASKHMAVKDPTTGALIVDRVKIKNTTVQYCKEVLTKNKTRKVLKKFEKSKKLFTIQE